jgi:hypothetical protein
MLKTGYAVENARTSEQAELMTNAAKQGKCIFCEIDFTKNKPLNRLGEFDPEGKDWPLLWVWESPFPQEHQERHIMILPKRHIDNENFNDEITDAEWLQILDARKWACKFFGIKGGGAVDRFGERRLNAGTVDHWHYQLQIPDGTGNVKATFFKDRSPAEEARRANRKAHTNKKISVIEGFTIRNNHGEFLSEHLHWVHNPFVHVENSLPYIFNALYEWNIPSIEEITIQQAAYSHATECTAPVGCIRTSLWGYLAHNANKKAYEQNLVQGYIFQNAEGLFLSSDFSWERKTSSENAFVHAQENFRRILAGFQHKNPWIVYEAEISADTKTATITGTLLDNLPTKL